MINQKTLSDKYRILRTGRSPPTPKDQALELRDTSEVALNHISLAAMCKETVSGYTCEEIPFKKSNHVSVHCEVVARGIRCCHYQVYLSVLSSLISCLDIPRNLLARVAVGSFLSSRFFPENNSEIVIILPSPPFFFATCRA